MCKTDQMNKHDYCKSSKVNANDNHSQNSINEHTKNIINKVISSEYIDKRNRSTFENKDINTTTYYPEGIEDEIMLLNMNGTNNFLNENKCLEKISKEESQENINDINKPITSLPIDINNIVNDKKILKRSIKRSTRVSVSIQTENKSKLRNKTASVQTNNKHYKTRLDKFNFVNVKTQTSD